jgi:hypothetical protein
MAAVYGDLRGMALKTCVLALANPRVRSVVMASKRQVARPSRAMMTASSAPKSVAATALKAARNRRLILFRVTALPTFFETVSPKRGPVPFSAGSVARRGFASITSSPVAKRKPPRTRRNSLRSVRVVVFLAGLVSGRSLGGRNYADRRLRPLARRRARTLRPPTVAIRFRKPWRRFRTSFDG